MYYSYVCVITSILFLMFSIRLCKLKDLPHHLQFNQYILGGYRYPTDAWGCLKSTVHLHNETFNILSHSR